MTVSRTWIAHRFPVARRFGGVMTALQELYVQPHDYRVVVIDPLDSLERLLLDETLP